MTRSRSCHARGRSALELAWQHERRQPELRRATRPPSARRRSRGGQAHRSAGSLRARSRSGPCAASRSSSSISPGLCPTSIAASISSGSARTRASSVSALAAYRVTSTHTVGIAKPRADDLQRLLRAHRIRADDQLWTNAVLLRPPPYPFGRLAAPGREWSLAVAKRRVVPGPTSRDEAGRGASPHHHTSRTSPLNLASRMRRDARAASTVQPTTVGGATGSRLVAAIDLSRATCDLRRPPTGNRRVKA